MARESGSEIIDVRSIDSLPEAERDLVKSAVEAAAKAYAPYSSFKVGASVLLDNGMILNGNNRENAAFPSGSCAERTVLSYTGANYPENKILTIAICALKEDRVTNEPVSPCGNCRQLIAEEEDRTGRPIKIILYGEQHTHIIEGIDTLLPLRFRFDRFSG